MADRLERFINLIAKTGDKLLVYDRHNPDESFIMVSLGEYERLLAEAKNVKDLTEDELIDKINCDIALWKSGQFNEPPLEAVSMPSQFSFAQDLRRPKPNTTPKKPKGNWAIPETRRREAENIIAEGHEFLEENQF